MPLPARRLAGEGEGRQIIRRDGDAKLLGEFAAQGLLGRFSTLHLAAGELPQPGMRLTHGALLHQEAPLIVGQRHRDDGKYFSQIGHVDTSLSLFCHPGVMSRERSERNTGMRFFTVRLMSDQRGATAIEYGLIVAVIVIALIAGFQNLASVTTGMWNNVNSAVTNAH